MASANVALRLNRGDEVESRRLVSTVTRRIDKGGVCESDRNV